MRFTRIRYSPTQLRRQQIAVRTKLGWIPIHATYKSLSAWFFSEIQFVQYFIDFFQNRAIKFIISNRSCFIYLLFHAWFLNRCRFEIHSFNNFYSSQVIFTNEVITGSSWSVYRLSLLLFLGFFLLFYVI